MPASCMRLIQYEHRRDEEMDAYPLCEIGRGGNSDARLGACHGPHRCCPVRLLFGGWKWIPVTKKGPIDSLGCASNTLFLLVICRLGGHEISSSVRSRLSFG
jgi:hypothetical protein